MHLNRFSFRVNSKEFFKSAPYPDFFTSFVRKKKKKKKKEEKEKKKKKKKERLLTDYTFWLVPSEHLERNITTEQDIYIINLRI